LQEDVVCIFPLNLSFLMMSDSVLGLQFPSFFLQNYPSKNPLLSNYKLAKKTSTDVEELAD